MESEILCCYFIEVFVLCRWYTMVHADGSLSQTWQNFKEQGLQGFINICPKPTYIACKIIFCYGVYEAALQLLLPGKRVEGPISPTGKRPVYKVRYIVVLSYWKRLTYVSVTWILSYWNHGFPVEFIAGKWYASIFCHFGHLSWTLVVSNFTNLTFFQWLKLSV